MIGNGIEPCSKLRLSAKFVEIQIHLHENIVREIFRLATVFYKQQAFIKYLFGIAVVQHSKPVWILGLLNATNQVLVSWWQVRHRIKYFPPV